MLVKQPCAVCREHKGGRPFRIRDDGGILRDITYISHCPYCGRFLAENYVGGGSNSCVDVDNSCSNNYAKIGGQ